MDEHLRSFLVGLVVGLDPLARFAQAIGPPDDWQMEVLRTDPVTNEDDHVRNRARIAADGQEHDHRCACL